MPDPVRTASRRFPHFLALVLCLLIGPPALLADEPPEPDPDAATLAIIGGPELVPGEGWRITWSTVPGRNYRLRHSHDLVHWTTVITLPATGDTLSHVDTAALGQSPNFWRVQLLDDDGVVIETPILDNFTATLTLLDGLPAVLLAVDAIDPGGVQGVVFLEGPSPGETDLVLGDAVPATTATWVLAADAPEDTFEVRYYKARATGVAGNVNELIRGFSLFDTRHFAALSADGAPLLGRAVAVRADGTFEPFAYLPDGPDGPVLSFPDGATPGQDAEGWFWHYQQADLRLAVEGDWEPAEDLAYTGSPLTFRPGPVELGDLLLAIGRDPAEGLRLTLWDRFEFILHEGAFAGGEIVAPRLEPQFAGFPLPEQAGGYAEFAFSLRSQGYLQLPFSGTFRLTLPSGHAVVRVPPRNPIWVRLEADGRLSMSGRVELELGDGSRLAADLTFDDPTYAFSFYADGLQHPALGALAAILPENPGDCLPADTAAADLDLATKCLKAYAKAYKRFATALKAGSASPFDSPLIPASPPAPDEAATAALDAWTFAAETDPSGPLPLEAITGLLGHASRSSAAAANLPGALRYLAALERTRRAVLEGEFSASTGALADLDAALDEATAAVLARAAAPGAIARVKTFE
ncbi:MAG: hypothetical protein EA425_16880 [Puniceicoccaceae bacterium]|nr:MAG: hypothetical protein EA425_16880 [Puniceicoccaceae bacterium]